MSAQRRETRATDPFHFATGLPLSRQRFYGFGLLIRGARLPPRGDWSGGFIIGVTGIYVHYHGTYKRNGRWMWLKAAPRKQPKTALRPAVNFG